MTLYEALKFLHVLGAICWLGGGITIQLVGMLAQKSGDSARLLAYGEIRGWFGPKFFAPVSGLTGLSGILLVIQSGWNFSDLWIVIGIAGFLTSALTGFIFLKPEGEKIGQAMKAGPPDAALLARTERIELVMKIDMAILILVVADMVIKPGL